MHKFHEEKNQDATNFTNKNQHAKSFTNKNKHAASSVNKNSARKKFNEQSHAYSYGGRG